MQWRFWLGGLVLICVGVWSVPGIADEGETEPEEVTSESQEAAEGEEAQEIEEPDDGEPEGDPDDEAEVEDPDVDSEESADAVEPEESAEEAEPVEGPGGAELRTDYPGTDEALEPRMDTGELEGMDIPEGEEPEEVYDLRVRELETQLDDLQEQVFRSKSRIALLRETVLAENLAGSRAVVTFENDLGSGYRVERAIFSVDGSQVFSEVDPNGELGDGIEIFSGPMAPGTHTVSVTLGLRGSGYGVFSYAEGYQFDLRFSCQFTAEEGRTTLVTVQSYESGNMFTAHEDRPDGLCEVSMVELTVEDLEDEETGSPELQEDLPELD